MAGSAATGWTIHGSPIIVLCCVFVLAHAATLIHSATNEQLPKARQAFGLALFPPLLLIPQCSKPYRTPFAHEPLFPSI